MLAYAGLFSKDSGVTMLDEKSFRAVMKDEVGPVSLIRT
jgi:hypothetical protein